MHLIEKKAVFEKYRMALFILAAISIVFILFSTSRFGVGLSSDSVGYISVARNILAGVGIRTYDGTPLVAQPPLYPFLLALVGKIFNMDPLAIARFLNAAIFGLIVYLGGILTFKHMSSSPTIAFIGAVLILFSSPLVAISVMAWSDSLFIVFVLLTLILADSYILKKDIHSLMLLSTAVALSCLTRYVGIALILCIPLIIILNHSMLVTKIKHLILFLLISSFPFVIWLIRNFVISKTLFGPRALAGYDLSQNLTFLLQTISSWYIPRTVIKHPIIYTYISVVAGIFAHRKLLESWKTVKSILFRTIPVFLFVAIYTMLILLTSTTFAYDRIGDRLLSPIYTPLTLLLLVLVYSIFEPFRRHLAPNIVNAYLIVGISIWAAYPIATSTRDAMNSNEFGHEFSGKIWRDSETIQYLREQQTHKECTCKIYTNCPDAFYILLNSVTKQSPAKTKYNSPEKESDLSELLTYWPEDEPAYLIWFDNINRRFLYKIDELRTIANFYQIARLKDGSIYSITKKSN